MNILFIFGETLTIGGHFKSAQALAKGLHAQGHQVVMFLKGGDARLRAEFEKVHALTCAYKPGWNDALPLRQLRTAAGAICVTRQLVKLVRKFDIDLLHCQDHLFVRNAILTACLTGKPLLCTQPGGEFINHLFPSRSPLVVYSQELTDAYRQLEVPFRPETILCLRERIDLEQYHPGEKGLKWLERHGVSPDATLLFAAIRLAPDKKEWLDTLFSMGERIQSPREVRILIAGDGPLKKEVEERSESFNQKHGDVKIHLLGGISDAQAMQNWIRCADVVVGNGRGLMEAMACGRAAMIAGERGELALLTAENMEEAAYWNFSGRQFRLHPDFDRAGPIQLDDGEIKKAAEEGQRYVRGNYDARKGAEKLIELYTEERPQLRWRDAIRWEIFRLKNRSILVGTSVPSVTL